MRTAIIYYSKHHGNTRKLLDAICAAAPEVDLIDVTEEVKDLSGYGRIGIASGIYFNSLAKQVLTYAADHLPERKPVFFIYTHGVPAVGFLKGIRFFKGIREIAKRKHCPELGSYHCRGFDTFGPFKLAGGIAKGHPTQDETDAAVSFYKGLWNG